MEKFWSLIFIPPSATVLKNEVLNVAENSIYSAGSRVTSSIKACPPTIGNKKNMPKGR